MEGFNNSNNEYNSNLRESFDQVRAFSKAFGGEEDDMASKIAMAQQLSAMMSKNDQQAKSQPQATQPFSTGDRKIDMIMAALPFVNPSLQGPISMVVNVMQMQNMLNKGTIMTQSISVSDNPAEKRKQLIKAIMPHMADKERQMIKMVMGVMEANQMMNFMGGKNNNE